MKRVVVTGAGPVSAIGIGREPFEAALRDGRSGVGPVSAFAAAGAAAGEIRGFQVADYLESQKNYLDRSSEFAFAALSLAFEDADLDPKSCADAALLVGSAYGNLGTMALFYADFAQKGPRLVKPVLFPHTYANTTISLLAMEYGLSGHQVHYSAGSVSSALALALAFDRIRAGRDTLALAGGFDSLNPALLAGWAAVPAGPFPPGEGACFLVLEERDRAMARQARILGELVGAGLSGNGRFAEAMAMACRDAAWTDGRIDRIMAHDTVNAAAAGAEGDALRVAAAVSPGLRMETIKPLTGDTLGASGALEATALLARGAASGDRRLLLNAGDPGGQCVCLAFLGGAA